MGRLPDYDMNASPTPNPLGHQRAHQLEDTNN